jgi:hypothetical protein
LLTKVLCSLFSIDFQSSILKIKLLLQKINFNLNYSKTDFLFFIDVESVIISKDICKKYNVKKITYFYEFYADSLEQPTKKLYDLKVKIEKEAYSTTNIILSTINNVCGDYLKERYNLNIKIVDFTICPENNLYKSEQVVNFPIKLYYHGLYAQNRGIEDAILAMKNTNNLILYLRGVGAYKNYLEKLVENNNLDTKVIFLDPVEMEMLSIEASKFDVGLVLVKMNTLNHIYQCGFKTIENISAGLALIMPKSFPLIKLNDNYNIGWCYDDATIDNLEVIYKKIEDNFTEIVTFKRNSNLAYKNYYNPEFQKEKLISILNNA